MQFAFFNFTCCLCEAANFAKYSEAEGSETQGYKSFKKMFFAFAALK